jgi:hypothetical protein
MRTTLERKGNNIDPQLARLLIFAPLAFLSFQTFQRSLSLTCLNLKSRENAGPMNIYPTAGWLYMRQLSSISQLPNTRLADTQSRCGLCRRQEFNIPLLN